MKNKKVASMVLSAVCICALLSGCGDAEEESRKLTVLTRANSYAEPMDEQQFWIDLAKEKNVEIELTQIPGADAWDNQKNVVLSSGELPDILLAGAVTNADVATYKEILMPMEDLIEEYAPNIKKAFEERPELKMISTSADGHIYTLTGLQPHRPGNAPILMINKQWLDELNLEIPHTLDEFYEVLVAFRDGDPNGNGIKDEIPFNFYPRLRYHQGVLTLIGAWGNYGCNNSNVLMFFDDEGKANFYGDSEDFKEFTKYIHKLYEEGLLSQEVLSADETKFTSLNRNKEVPVVGALIAWQIGSEFSSEFHDQYVAIKPLCVSENVTPIWACDPLVLQNNANTASITISCKNPQAAIEWLDGFYEEEYAVQAFWGSNGVGTEVTEENGEKHYTQIIQGDEGADTSRYTLSLSSWGPLYCSPELQTRITPPEQMQQRLQQGSQIYENYWPRLVNPISALSMTDEVSQELSIIQTDLWSVVDTQWSDWIVNGGIDEGWDKYVEELHKIGSDRMTEIYQEAFDSKVEEFGMETFYSDNYKSERDYGYDFSYLD